MFTPARRRRSRQLAAEHVDSPPLDPFDSDDMDETLPPNLAGDEKTPLPGTSANIPATTVETTISDTSAKEIPPLKGDAEEDKPPRVVGGASQPTNQTDTLGEANLVGKDTQPSSGTAKPSYIPAEKIEDNDRLWKDYVKEAAEEDKDMLDSWNNDLETLLVFSGLFSAILTAFLIESHKDLKPDPSSAIVAAIERGFRLANNITDSSPISSISNSEQFTAQIRSVRINALWFSSLSMSLISAAGAMLGKSWLVAYSQQLSIGSPVQRAEKRQNRFDGLKRWRFQATIDFLPFPLFLSIILFAIGLCDFLFGLHQMIGILSATIFISSSSFLAIANLLRIIIPDCPYHIPIPVDPPSIKDIEAFARRLEGRYYPIRHQLVMLKLDIPYRGSTWLAVPPLVVRYLATLIPFSAVCLLHGLIKLFFTLVRLNERWVASYSPESGWQARGLAWLVRSSSDDGVVRNALQLIPAVCTRVPNIDALCKTEVLNALKERFVEAINTHAERRSGTGTVESELTAETSALGHSLRLLAGYRRHMLRGVAWSAETRFGQIGWVKVVPPSHSTPIHLLCKSLSLVTYHHPSVNRSYSVELQADLVWGLKPVSGLDDWLRLFLIQHVTDLHLPLANNDGIEGTLSMICDLMGPVKLTWHSSAIFLSAIENLYSDLDFSDRTITPTSILARYDSANFEREFASILSRCANKIKDQYEEHGGSERYMRLLQNASIILLKITDILQEKISLDDPNAPNYNDIKSFIKWTLTNSNFPIYAYAEAIKILANLKEEYTAGWEGEGEIKTRCVEVISQFRGDPTQEDSTISAADWLIIHMVEMGIEGGRIALGFLEDYPEAAAGIVAIIQRNEPGEVWRLWLLETSLSTKGFRSRSEVLCISPLNDNAPDEATSLTRQIISKLIDAGLKEAVISRLTSITKNGENELWRGIRLILWTVCGSSLAKSFILDHRFTAQLISCAKRPLSLPKDKWQYVAILVQLSYQVVDLCSDEEQVTWHRSLIELDFLAVYATLLPFLKDRRPEGSMMWDIQCSFPVLQALVQVDRVAVAESKVLEVINAVLQSFASSGVELDLNYIWSDTGSDNESARLSANTVLQELNKIQISMGEVETGPHPTTLPTRDDELPL